MWRMDEKKSPDGGVEVILTVSDVALCFQLSVVVFCVLFCFASVLESPGLR